MYALLIGSDGLWNTQTTIGIKKQLKEMLESYQQNYNIQEEAFNSDLSVHNISAELGETAINIWTNVRIKYQTKNVYIACRDSIRREQRN